MVLKSDIKQAFEDQQKGLHVNQPHLIERDIMFNYTPTTGMIEVISGIRRCGKSTMMIQIKEKFYSNPGFFNFEDSRVFGFEVADFPKLMEVTNDTIDTWFFDEIQNVAGWEVFVRQLHDSGKKVFVTGSNASLLSRELGSKLTGRHIRHELFPFSYNEYMRFCKKQNSYTTVREYMQNGGFPIFLQSNNGEVLQTLFKDILLRDIAVRYGIKNSTVLMNLALHLVSNASKEFTYNSLRKKFSIGSTNTVSDFLTWMEVAYLFVYLQKFSWSPANRMANPRKIYVIDTGLAYSNSLSFSEDRGRLFENMIFSQLRKSGMNIFYFKEDRECDFVLFQKRKFEIAIQVCEQITNENMQRECEGLLEGLEKFKSNNGYIVTLNQDETIQINGKKIRLIPAKDFLMGL